MHIKLLILRLDYFMIIHFFKSIQNHRSWYWSSMWSKILIMDIYLGNLDYQVEAEKVIEQLNGSDLKDREIVVNEARKRNEPLEIPIT